MISLGRSLPGKLSGSLAAAAVLLLALPGAAVGAMAFHRPPKPSVVGHVYTETNGAAGNRVIIFNRLSNGKLKRVRNVATGGKGGLQNQPGCTSPPLPPPGCPIVDSQNAVILNKAGTLLFVVNAGSNTITSFRVGPKGGLKLVSIAPSGGVFPNSLTLHGGVLYVLNSGSPAASGHGASLPDISGLAVTAKGKLIPIAHSTQPLVVPGGHAIPGLPRQVGFDNSGHVLMVSLLANTLGPPPVGGTKDTIDTFPVNSHGQAGPGTAHDSTTKFPFGFVFNKQNQSIMTQLNSAATPAAGSAQRYTAGGTPIGGTVTTIGNAPCWVVVTKNGRHAYIVNTGAGAPGGATVAEYSIGPSGALTRLVNTRARNEFVLTDEALTGDNRYLYVVSPLESGSTMPGGTTHIDEFRVLPNGRLQYIGKTPSLPLPGLTGIAAT